MCCVGPCGEVAKFIHSPPPKKPLKETRKETNLLFGLQARINRVVAACDSFLIPRVFLG